MRLKPSFHPEPLLREFSAADVDQTIAQRFEQQAHRFPERVAIKTPERAITYDELNRSANRIARAIIDSAGTGPAPVALYFRGGAPSIAAGLGALKAGKPYAPLDVQLPKSKAQRIVASLESSLVLSDERNLAAARKLTGKSKKVLNIDELDGSLSTDDLGLSFAPDSIAYINFTSGSTGEPKGVVWNHRSELFGIRAKTNALRITAADRVSLLRANNVGAVRDMHLALLNGAAAVTVDLQESGLASLASWLRDEEVSVLSCVATVFRQAVESAKSPADFARIRLVHIGGEPIFKSDVDLYKRYFPDHCQFVNRYSISETQAVCYFFIDKQSEIAEERVPVGYPLDGSEVAIIDDEGNELASGAVGEITVTSPYLALGYWRQPKLTGEKFAAHPRSPGVRTYRTGDLGYQLADGALVHVGRKDFQVKIRGHRVDLTAIETALHEITAVRQAVVVARDDGHRGARMIAYVVPRKTTAPAVKELRAQLKIRLPAHMIPAAFVFQKRLPVNSGGKIDRRALPAPAAGRRGGDGPAVAARSALEEVLLTYWRDALGVENFGVHDDFTELGGDSLLGARIVTRVNETFPLSLPLASLFEAPTVAQLASWLIAHETQPGQAEKIASMLLHVEGLSDTEIFDSVAESEGAGRDR
jgi:amino acid adenylation domain-containing protein